MLKADLHLHAGEDVFHKLGYTSKELIDYMAKLGFKVIALTFHKNVHYNKELVDYADKKGILLISGVERFVDGVEVLIYNLTNEEAQQINSFEELRAFKKKKGKKVLVIAPHPFFLRKDCLGDKLVKNIDLFDAIEYSHFYLSSINLNKKAVRVARKHGVPVVGNSDAHAFSAINHTYSLIDSKKDLESVFKAIRSGKITIKTKPVPLKYFISRGLEAVFSLK